MKIRSFLAFDIPGKVKEKLARLIADFSKKEKGVKWVKAENMHLTMKFFGDVEEDILLGSISSKIEETANGFGPINLQCEGIGVFPDWKYPRVLWAGFFGETDKILDLNKKLEDLLLPFKLHKDNREFRVHLTIGRAVDTLDDSPIVETVESLGPVNFGEVKLEKLVLYKSVLTKTGPVYTPLKEFSLLK